MTKPKAQTVYSTIYAP